MMEKSDALVVFGFSGDLASKKIFPALYAMLKSGALTVPVVGDEVKIEFEAELVKQAPEGTQSTQQGTHNVTTVKQPSMAR